MIINIVKKLFPFDYSICGKGNDSAIKVFKKYLNFKIHSFESGKSLNGWIIPHSWFLKKGIIFDRNYKIIFNAKNKNFAVPVLSKSFKGKISLKKLKEKIFLSKYKKFTPYNWTNLYRKNFINWGFCMNHKEFKKLKEKNYFIDLITKTKKSKMKVLEYTLKGKNKETILINAHNCHPYQANDDISGCAVGIQLFKNLKKIKNRKFTYKLLIAPEIFGPLFWLKRLGNKIKHLKYCILLKSVGNKNIIKLQHSSDQNSQIDIVALEELKKLNYNFIKGRFREIYGNDETVFDSPGYGIKTISLTRYPFKEYHTDADTPKKISEKKLQDVLKLLQNIIFNFEKGNRYKCNFHGVISLSNKKYNLYKRAEAPGIDKVKYSANLKKWNILMNNLPNLFDSFFSIEQISKIYSLPKNEVLKYCLKWKNKNLLKKI
jgi:aminopeptidase-like protein